MLERKCTACGYVKPYDAFYRTPNKDLKKIQRCLSCEKERWHKVKSKSVFIGPKQQSFREKELYEKELREITLQVKTCSRCNKEKSFKEFGSCKNRVHGLHIFCLACVREERLFKYNNDENYKNNLRESIKAWRRANKDKVFEHYRRDYTRHKGRFLKQDRIRRAILDKLEHRTDEEWNLLLLKYKNRCTCCLKLLDLTKNPCKRVDWATEDHIVPLSKGGNDTIDNLQPLCFSCNSGKNNYNNVNYMIDFEDRLQAKLLQS